MKNIPSIIFGILILNALILSFGNIATFSTYQFYFISSSGSLFTPFVIMFGIGVLTGLSITWMMINRKNNKQVISQAEDMEI
jgi:hypothetical protein